MEVFSIRKLTAADEPVVWEMLYQAIHVPAGEAPPPRSIVNEPGLAHYARDWGQRPGDLGVVAEEVETGQAVGAAWLRLFSADDPGYGFVDEATPELSIALLPGYRGRGLGSRLMQALLAEAGQRFEQISLSVSKDNAAKRMYERMGFVVVGEEEGGAAVMVRKVERGRG